MNSKAILFISGGVVTGTALLFTHAKSNPVKNASKAPRNNGETWDSNWDNRENAKPRGTRNIIMIRHGQYNREGKNDLEKTLTELGKKQAVYTGIRLVELGLDKKLDIVYESTKTRALETSELIYRQLNKDIPILKTDLLREGSPTWPDPPFDSSFMPDEETVTQDFVKMERAFAHLMHRADADQNDDTYELEESSPVGLRKAEMKSRGLKLVGVVASSCAAFAVFRSETWNKHGKTFSPFAKTAHAAVIEATKWDNDWDKRACEKPSATRHIILVRHGQYNMAGKSDEDRYLTELGKEQALFTGLRLKELGLDKKLNLVTYSTMRRAQETCDLIYKQLDAPIALEKTELLREGAPVEPDPPVTHWSPDPKTFFVDGARIETAFRHFVHRADPEQKDDSYELLVCHANVIRYFALRALQLQPDAWLRISLRHASITWISVRPNGRVSLRCLGDAGHIPSDKLTFE